MRKFGDVFKSDDWKKEKHVPVIDCADSVKAGGKLEIKLSVGKDIPHPNTTEHHIRWIQLYFQPEGEAVSYQLANCEFTAHGESTQGADKGPAHTDHSVTVAAMLNKSGSIYAISFCNIHGLWENSKDIKVS